MVEGMINREYDREKSVEYAHKWALDRNPKYISFNGIGGDCGNFGSQCIHAGGGVMNYKKVFGWYYNQPEDRAPGWSGVEYFYNFITKNVGAGPWGKVVELSEVSPGDIIHIAISMPQFHHTLVVVKAGKIKAPSDILVAAHSYDSDNRSLSSYDYKKIRAIHIEGIRSYK